MSSKRDGELLERRLSSPVRFPSCRLLSRGDCIVDLQDEGSSDEGGSDRLHVGSIGGTVEPAEIMRIPTGPALRPAPTVADRLDRMVLLGLTLVLATWIALYVLPS